MPVVRILTAISVAAIALPAHAAPAATASLGSLLRSSDAAIVATIGRVSRTGDTTVLSANVLRIIKGPIPAGRTVEITSTATERLGTTLAGFTGRPGIWFLKRSSTEWIVMPVIMGDVPLDFAFVPVPSSDPSNITDGASPEDRLSSELFAGLAVDQTAASAEEFLTTGMSGVLSPQLNSTLAVAVKSPSLRIRRVAVSMLLRVSSPQSPAQLAALSMPEIVGDTHSSLARALCQFRAASDEDTRTLGRLSAVPFPESIRSCATYSLRASHTAASLPFLTGLLDEKNADMRYDALAGVASFALHLPTLDGVPAFPTAGKEEDMRHYPSRALFDQNEQLYISYWKNWLAQR